MTSLPAERRFDSVRLASPMTLLHPFEMFASLDASPFMFFAL